RSQMKRLISLASLLTVAALPFSQAAHAQHAEYNALVATHAQANGVPEVLVHRVIVRESRYHPALVGRGGTIGLMQIKLATARGQQRRSKTLLVRTPCSFRNRWLRISDAVQPETQSRDLREPASGPRICSAPRSLCSGRAERGPECAALRAGHEPFSAVPGQGALTLRRIGLH